MRDYTDISRRHKDIARCIVKSPNKASWDAFIAEIRKYVIEHFAARLKREAGIEVDDFLQGDLMQYFAAEKCEKLRQFLSLRGPTCHFGTPWFTEHLRAATERAIESVRNKIPFTDPIVEREDGEQVDLAEGMRQSDALVSAETETPGDPITVAIEQGGEGLLNKILCMFWNSAPHECYAAMMDWSLGFDHRKIAALFGSADAIPIAGYLRNLKRKIRSGALALLKKSFEDDDRETLVSLYKADGRQDDDNIELIGKVRSRLCFRGIRNDGYGGFRIEMRFPIIVGKGLLIRCSLIGAAVVDALKRTNPDDGALFVCGAFRKIRTNGDFEIPVEEFAQYYKSSEMYFVWRDGNKTAAIPFISSEREQYTLTGERVRKWAMRHVSGGNDISTAAEFLNDFGPALSVMLARTDAAGCVPTMTEVLSRFGIPTIDRAKIRRKTNEAWLLFRADLEIAADSPLDSKGFLLPVEWVYDSFGAGVRSRRLPENLIALGDKVLRSFGVEGWRLEPSARFFDERVSFCDESLFGKDEESVASATVALAVALEYATRRIAYPKWPFNSIVWDFAGNVPRSVGGLRQKALLARNFGAKRLFVAPEQDEVTGVDNSITFVRTRQNSSLLDLAQEIAYHHLARIRPAELATFRIPNDDEYLEKRRKTVDAIRAKVNTKTEREPRSTFVTLFGRPGMGKSVLMGLLARDMERRKWAVLPFVCRAGRTGQGLAFAKSLAYALARQFGEVHELYAGLDDVPSYAVGEALVEFYMRAVCEPISAMARKYSKLRQIVIVVDGLDEDAGGEVLSLLSNPKFKMPVGVGVVVSSRRLPQDADRLAALSTAVIDLNGNDARMNDDCDMDLKAYIELWLLRNGNVSRALLDANASSDVVKETICRKDKSFLYAYHVLNGVAEGRYSLDRLNSELPVDLRAAFFDSFVARFPSEADYGRVKPLLRRLTASGEASLAAAKECAVAAEMNIGQLIQSLRGYVAIEGERVVLTGEPLREWLTDELGNPRFGVGK